MRRKLSSLFLLGGLAAILAFGAPTPAQALWGYESFNGGYYDDSAYDDDWYYDYYDYGSNYGTGSYGATAYPDETDYGYDDEGDSGLFDW